MTTFSKRHYISLAIWCRYLPESVTREEIILSLAEKFAEDSENFPTGVFIESAKRQPKEQV